MYRNCNVEELQRMGLSGDNEATLELGRRVLKWNMCNTYTDPVHSGITFYCEHLNELQKIEMELDSEPPPELYEQGFDAGAKMVLELPLWQWLRQYLTRKWKRIRRP